ncbi:NAD-dependent epimerase/dehydratase family protein [Paenibacillus sp. CGMCC 1.16610]|uniref:NAD-dependent epimerase/dehydratase family protein n=1 Tax=Paenibacillus anseongense TaxID=2682845 RepID=A0ABW9U5S1_9BACL|nr:MULTISPECIES: NAD-dependent epimerase/dehydratase family protein [Paenibacillus]MBA2942394.1 NAD-dependent epimerase/dehydratase family protein [Paenibacillus sp. CGMCC 1.16610]MVQ34469.1 NAD-dependent epimerase/dehydratase family protein [Paenibacillus anseongense]
MNRILANDFLEISKHIKNKDQFKNTKWVITGSTGMIGSYLVSFLSWFNKEFLNHSLSIIATYRNELNAFHPILKEIYSDKLINFKKIDVGTEFDLPELKFVDFVIHTASNAAPQSYISDPIGTINANIRATEYILDQLKDSVYLKSFLYISSGEIYGNPSLENVPTRETYIGETDHLSLRSCYVESKKFAETICYNYYRTFNIPVTMVRPIHVYGPGFKENDSRVWADFIIKATKENHIEILGDGTPRRGFCYISDAILQMINVLVYGRPGEAYNIGNSHHISIKDLANVVAASCSRSVSVYVKNELPEYLKTSPQISCPDMKKTSELGKLFSTDIEVGIARTISWYQNPDEMM